MKAVSAKEIKQGLQHLSSKELMEICLRLSRFKKENKELLTYLLFEAQDESGYVESVKSELDEQFSQINKKSYYFMRKSVRKILKNAKKFIRYSQNKQTEVDVLLYFCLKLKTMKPSITRDSLLQKLYDRQIDAIIKKVSALHEDLQYDYGLEIAKLNEL